jgi:hypothetical protein
LIAAASNAEFAENPLAVKLPLPNGGLANIAINPF